MGNWTKNRLLESGSTSVVIPAGTSAQRPDSPIFGQFRFNVDIAKLEFFNGTIFAPLASAGALTYAVDSFTGDGSTVAFTMSVEVVDPDQILVFIGSIYQNPGASQPGGPPYTVDGGFDITFASAPPDGEPISVIHSSV